MLSMTPMDRFRNDDRFHAVVGQMVNMLEAGVCDGATLQQAAIFACIRYGMIHGMKPHPLAEEFLRMEYGMTKEEAENGKVS